MLKPLPHIVTERRKKKKKREKEKIVGGGRTREEMVRSYLTVTSSVNLSTRCVRMLRGMELPPSILWGGLFFRHAGRVELCVRAPPTRGGERTTCKERQRKTKMTHAADRSKQRHSRWRGRKHMHGAKQARRGSSVYSATWNLVSVSEPKFTG